MATNRLYINFDQLNKTIDDYDRAIIELQKSITNVEKSMSILEKSGWKSGASNAYFSQYEEKWRVAMNAHLITLQYMKSCLADARKDYINMYDRAKSLANNL